MKEMKKLVVNGVSYTIADPDAAVIDDQKIGADAWSSKNIVDKLCPSFTESGAIVTCQPIERYPLGVVSKITYTQEGSGNPSPNNVRPIIGHSAVNLTRNDETFTIDLGQTVCYGSFNWTSGVLTIDKALDRLSGDMNWKMSSNHSSAGIYSFYADGFDNMVTASSNSPVISSHYPHEYNWSVSDVSYKYAIKLLNARVYIADLRFTDVDSFKAYLDAENVQLLYPLIEPITIQLTPQEIIALQGVNTLQSDTGDTTVTGKVDPTAVIEKLTNAIIALGGNV